MELLNTMGTFKVGLNTFYNMVRSLWIQGVEGYGFKLICFGIKLARGRTVRVDVVNLTDSRFILEESLNEGLLCCVGPRTCPWRIILIILIFVGRPILTGWHHSLDRNPL